MARKSQEECELNMTPMIDVVFQLIIFFVVTINMSDNRNQDIRLTKGEFGPEIKNDESSNPLTAVIEIDRRGHFSMNAVPLSAQQLRNIIDRRLRKYGAFPIMIRADYRTKHKDVRAVMDICSGLGLARVAFVAVKDPRTDKGRQDFDRPVHVK